MKKLFTSRFAMGLILVSVTVIAGVAVWARRTGNHIDQLRVENLTRSLIIESVDELEPIEAGPQTTRRLFRMTVRNGYSQPLVAYSYRQQDSGVGKNSIAGGETNGATNGWVLPPNGTDITHIGAPSEGEIVITFAAVLLEDGTGDGDSLALSRLRENRDGVKIAYQQIVPLLRRAATSTESVAGEVAVQNLAGEISAIADEKTVPPNLRAGYHEAKEFLVNSLKDLEANLSSGRKAQHRAEIAKMKSRVDEILAKLEKSAPF
jgi:hypothetical protein